MDYDQTIINHALPTAHLSVTRVIAGVETERVDITTTGHTYKEAWTLFVKVHNKIPKSVADGKTRC